MEDKARGLSSLDYFFCRRADVVLLLALWSLIGILLLLLVWFRSTPYSSETAMVRRVLAFALAFGQAFQNKAFGSHKAFGHLGLVLQNNIFIFPGSSIDLQFA